LPSLRCETNAARDLPASGDDAHQLQEQYSAGELGSCLKDRFGKIERDFLASRQCRHFLQRDKFAQHGLQVAR
jgi:hypothetical protein